MQWCAPDADALLNDGKPIKAAFVHGCSHPANLSLLKRSLVQPSNGDVIFINVGANKGYEVASFLELVVPSRGTTGLRWLQALRQHAVERRSGYLRYSSIGACSDGKRAALPHLGAPTLATGVRVHVHAFEMMQSTAAMLSSVVNATGVSDLVTVHALPVTNASRIVRIPRGSPMGDERNSLCLSARYDRSRSTPCMRRGMAEVRATSMDDFLERERLRGPVFQLTVDTEGWDSLVLDGLRRSLRSQLVRLLEFEYVPSPSPSPSPSPVGSPSP